jgi:hypothetical protein
MKIQEFDTRKDTEIWLKAQESTQKWLGLRKSGGFVAVIIN